MENTSFNYQPRDPQAQINWAEAASNLGNVFKEEARVRTEKKAAIDKDIRETQKIFAAGVPGESTSIREWGLNYAGVAEEQLDMITSLLKSGQMSVSDYTINKQNLVDGTEEAFSLMENYQEVFAEKMARLQEQDPSKASQGLEGWIMENVEGFGDFNKTQLVVDPGTGKVMVGKKVLNEKTGLMEISKNPEDLAPVSSLKHNIISQFNKYDVEKFTTNFVKELGTMTTINRTSGSRRKAGQILTTTLQIPVKLNNDGERIMTKITPKMAKELGLKDEGEVEELNNFLVMEDAAIGAQLSNPYNMTSVFTDYISETDGKSNSFTLNPEEAKENPNLILIERKGATVVPVFDSRNPNAKKQKEDIIKYMKYSIRRKAGLVEGIKTYKDWNAMPAHYDKRYWDRGKGKDKDPEADLENVEDAYVRILKDEILPISEGVNIFIPDNESATAKNLQNVLNTQLNLEGFSVSEADFGNDVVEVRDSKGELVKSFDLDNIDASTAEKYMYDIYDISSTYANKDQVVFQIAEKRLSKVEGDKKAKERRGQRYGEGNTTATAATEEVVSKTGKTYK